MPVSTPKAGRCVEIDRQYVSTGVMFEPLKGHRMFFYYSVIRWGDSDETELVIITDTHRVIVRGCRLGSLGDGFREQRVKIVRAVPKADQMLAEIGENDTPVVEEILIEYLGEEGPPLPFVGGGKAKKAKRHYGGAAPETPGI